MSKGLGNAHEGGLKEYICFGSFA